MVRVNIGRPEKGFGTDFENYRLVLIRLKEGLDPEAVKAWQTEGKAMVGKVPGLQSFEVNSPFPWSAHKSEGRFNMAVVAVLEKPEHVETYEVHPIHDA
jgi:hypothetical protein